MTSTQAPDAAASGIPQTDRAAQVLATLRELGSKPLAPKHRLFAAAATWLMLCLAQPGVGRPGGFGHIAFIALVPWALYCSRPGRKAFLMEWAAAAVGLALWSIWLRHVVEQVLYPIGFVTALYVCFAGVTLRVLAGRFPLALACPAAWLAGELPRWCLEAPFSFGWWRLGMMFHDTDWILMSSRLWGMWGLTWIFAAFAGCIADKLRHRQACGKDGTRMPRSALAWGLGPLFLGIVLNYTLPGPELEDGPDVLLITPGISQEVKQSGGEPMQDLYGSACQLTHEALEARRAAGASPPDLVAWGETMLVPFETVAPGYTKAWQEGMRYFAWTGYEPAPWRLSWIVQGEARGVQGPFFGGPLDEFITTQLEALGREGQDWTRRVLGGTALLDPGTSFLSGVVHHLPLDGNLRRQNALFLWDAAGERHGPAAKVHLVPGAESLAGAQAFPWVTDAVRAAGQGYVPDFAAAEESAVLPLRGRAGGEWRFSATTCYDNAFDDPYTAPLRRERVDFHLVASNEAWYLDSYEMNHMLAFSRCVAASTARSVVRATNSGITIVIDPRGATVAELVVGGKRKLVRGTLSARVPVPVRGEEAPVTFYARTQPWQPFFWAGIILLLFMLARRPIVTQDVRPDRPLDRSQAPPNGA